MSCFLFIILASDAVFLEHKNVSISNNIVNIRQSPSTISKCTHDLIWQGVNHIVSTDHYRRFRNQSASHHRWAYNILSIESCPPAARDSRPPGETGYRAQGSEIVLR